MLWETELSVLIGFKIDKMNASSENVVEYSNYYVCINILRCCNCAVKVGYLINLCD